MNKLDRYWDHITLLEQQSQAKIEQVKSKLEQLGPDTTEEEWFDIVENQELVQQDIQLVFRKSLDSSDLRKLAIFEEKFSLDEELLKEHDNLKQ